jgi:predicted nucleic acid-binding protein
LIVYLDASALVKRYVQEAGSGDVDKLIADAGVVATSVLSRAEVGAALARASRAQVLVSVEARAAVARFEAEWPSLLRIQATEVLAAQASALAWVHALRGFDAMHLASALFLQAMLAGQVTVATYDRQLWTASGAAGLTVWPNRWP